MSAQPYPHPSLSEISEARDTLRDRTWGQVPIRRDGQIVAVLIKGALCVDPVRGYEPDYEDSLPCEEFHIVPMWRTESL